MDRYVFGILDKKLSIVIKINLLLICFIFIPVNAQNDEWKSAIVYPGSQEVLSANPNFTECFTVETYFQKDWFKCTDVNHKSPLSWDEISNKVYKNYDFTISEPGYLYFDVVTRVAENIFYYADPVISLSKLDPTGKWQPIWWTYGRYINYHGSKLRNPQPPKWTYKINPDGSLKFYNIPPHFLPGRYRVTVVSATRFNNNTAERTYIKSSAKVKVYFVPEGIKVTEKPNVPKLDFEWTINGNVFVNDKPPTSKKISLTKGMTFTFQDPGGSVSNGMTIAVGEGGAKIMVMDIKSGLEADGSGLNNVVAEKIIFGVKEFGKGLGVVAATAKGLWSTLWRPNPSVKAYQSEQWQNFKKYAWNNTKIVLTNFWNAGIDSPLPDYVPIFGGRISVSSITKDFLLNTGVSKVLGKIAISHKGFGKLLNKLRNKTIFGKSLFGKTNSDIFNSTVPLFTDLKRFLPTLKSEPNNIEQPITFHLSKEQAGWRISPQSSGVLDYWNDGSIKLTVDEGDFTIEKTPSFEKKDITTGQSTWIIPPKGNGGQNIDIDDTSQNKIFPTADAYVYAYNYRNWNRSNRGKYEQLVAGWNPTGGESRIYMKFDLPNKKPEDINKAVVKLYHTSTSGNNSLQLGVYRVTSPWNEGNDTYHSGQIEKIASPGEISWVNQPAVDSYPVTEFVPPKVSSYWVDIDITNLVKEWVGGLPNYGFVIKVISIPSGYSTQSVYRFYSKEIHNSYKRPVLVINPNISKIANLIQSVLKGGTYKVEQFLGRTYRSTWKLRVENSKITGTSEWSCCPGKRIDLLRGKIDGKNVIIERDCSGQNWSGTCTQIFKGQLKNDRIEGTCSGTGIVGSKKWVLYLTNNNILHTNNQSIDGKWSLFQDNGYTGTMNLQKSSSGYFTGNVIWNGYLKGSISGNISGNAVSITIDYHNGDIGYYNGTLTADGNKIINGTTKSNNGVSANWTGTKVISHTIYDQRYNIWAVNSAGNIYDWNGKNWDFHPGKAQDIGVGANGTVWVIGPGSPNGSIYRWMGKKFVKVPGGAVRVDVDQNGIPWVVNAQGEIYKWENKTWRKIPGGAYDIGIGAHGTVWVIGRKPAYGGYGIYRWMGKQFVKVPGAAVRIDVGPWGTPWVVNSFGDIFKWENKTWQKLPGKAKDISVGSDGTAWIIGTNSVLGGYGIYKWNGSKWMHIPGGATAISVGGYK